MTYTEMYLYIKKNDSTALFSMLDCDIHSGWRIWCYPYLLYPSVLHITGNKGNTP